MVDSGHITAEIEPWISTSLQAQPSNMTDDLMCQRLKRPSNLAQNSWCSLSTIDGFMSRVRTLTNVIYITFYLEST